VAGAATNCVNKYRRNPTNHSISQNSPPPLSLSRVPGPPLIDIVALRPIGELCHDPYAPCITDNMIRTQLLLYGVNRLSSTA
jgi:hypothetical protein